MTDVATGEAAPAQPTSGRRAAGDIAIQIVGRLGNGVLGVAVMVLVTRTLGTADFGRWTTLLTLISLAGPLTEVGISQVAITRAAARPAEEAAWLGALLALRVGLALAVTVLTAGAVLLVADGTSMRVAGLILLVAVLGGGLQALTAVFQLRVRNDLLVVVMTVNSVLWTAGVVVVAALGGGLVGLAVAFALAAVISTGLQSGLALRRASVALTGWRERGRELVRVGLPLSISTVLVISYIKADQLLVFFLAGERAAGLYGAAYRILDQAVVVPISVVTTLYPILVRAHEQDPERFRFLVQRALEALVALGLGGLAFAIPCGGDALALLFGEAFRPAGPTLAILMGAFLVTCVSYLNGSLVLIFGLQRRLVAIAATGLVVNLALNVALVPSYGYVASAWVTLATELVVVVLTSRATVAALAWEPSLGVIVRALLAAGLTAGVLGVATALEVPIGVLLVLTPLLYGGALVATGGLRLGETVALVRPGRDG